MRKMASTGNTISDVKSQAKTEVRKEITRDSWPVFNVNN